jgi:GTP-binding protein HflX
LVPYDRGDVISRLHVRGSVLATEYEESGTRVHARVHPDQVAELEPFRA